jgi:hypothetical protein
MVNATVEGSVISCTFATRLQNSSDSYGMARDFNVNFNLLRNKAVVAGNQANAIVVLVHPLAVVGTERIDGRGRGTESDISLTFFFGPVTLTWLLFVS